MKLEKLDLSVRTFNILKRAGIDTVEELAALSDTELQNIRNLGRRSYDEIKEKLSDIEVAPKTIPWTDIVDGLPPIGVPLIVTVYDIEQGERTVMYPVMYRKSFRCEKYGFYDAYGSYLEPEWFPTIAWIEIPSPYEKEVE